MCTDLFVELLMKICILVTMHGGTVNNPVESGNMQYGINLYLDYHDIEQASSFERSTQLFLDRMAESGVNSISLTWPIFMEGSRSSFIGAGDKTPSIEGLTTFIRIAKARGFSVWLQPLLDEQVFLEESRTSWRGSIKPNDISQWFQSYDDLIIDYAEMAQKTNADGIVIATEFWSMESYNKQWGTIVENIRSVYGGLLTYATNRPLRDTEFDWNLIDYIGINYFPNFPNVPSDISIEDLKSLMQDNIDNILKDKPKKIPIFITETGVTAQYNALRVTGRWDHRTRYDESIQALFYQSVCQSWSSRVSGIYWWNTTIYLNEGSGLFSPFNRETEKYVSCQ